jgi:hypothetical protein
MIPTVAAILASGPACDSQSNSSSGAPLDAGVTEDGSGQVLGDAAADSLSSQTGDGATQPPPDDARSALSPPWVDAGADREAGLVVLGCDGGFGTIGALFMGVPAYCQDLSNRYYQCDELGNRFMRDAWQHPNLDNVATEYASIMCAHAAGTSAYSVWGPNYRDATGNHPVPGDLVVWSGFGNVPGGHVAVVTGVDPGAVHFMQQNNGAPTGSIGWDAGASFFADPNAECWIHAEPSPAPQVAGSSCGCFDGEGDYCGLALVDHEWWFGCVVDVQGNVIDYDTLYSCHSGVFQSAKACGHLCVTENMSPAYGHCT